MYVSMLNMDDDDDDDLMNSCHHFRNHMISRLFFFSLFHLSFDCEEFSLENPNQSDEQIQESTIPSPLAPPLPGPLSTFTARPRFPLRGLSKPPCLELSFDPVPSPCQLGGGLSLLLLLLLLWLFSDGVLSEFAKLGSPACNCVLTWPWLRPNSSSTPIFIREL